jgi:hypothetical protein
MSQSFNQAWGQEMAARYFGTPHAPPISTEAQAAE